jgi:sulfur-carrier protein
MTSDPGAVPSAPQAESGESTAAGTDLAPIPLRVVLPAHLRNLAGIAGEVSLVVPGRPTVEATLDALEAAYPVLCGTVRDQRTKRRRAFVRFYACEQDLSHDSPDELLPPPVVAGKEPFLIVGAMAGG